MESAPSTSYTTNYKQTYPVQPHVDLQTNDILLENGCLVQIIEGELSDMNSDAVVHLSCFNYCPQSKYKKYIYFNF